MSMGCDEVIIIDTSLWVSIHVYIMKDWDRYSLILSLQKLSEGATFMNLKEVIVGALATNVGMHWSQVAQKLVSFGAYCVSIFEGVHTRVIVQNQRMMPPSCQGFIIWITT